MVLSVLMFKHQFENMAPPAVRLAERMFLIRPGWPIRHHFKTYCKFENSEITVTLWTQVRSYAREHQQLPLPAGALVGALEETPGNAPLD